MRDHQRYKTGDERIRQMYKQKRSNAKSSGIDFSLTFDEFKDVITAKRCAYTGITLTQRTGVNSSGANVTIDRVFNGLGYVAGNVVACCFAYNALKGNIESPGQIISFSMLRDALDAQEELMRQVFVGLDLNLVAI